LNKRVVMPQLSPKRFPNQRDRTAWGAISRKSRITALATASVLAACTAPATSDQNRPLRIVSLDYCADQFVLRLADRAQIAGLSPDASASFSYMRDAAAGLPRVRPNAEDVLALRPDLVVRSYGGGFDVAASLQRAGVAVAQLGYAEEFRAIEDNVRSMGARFGHPDRGDALVVDMRARLDAIATNGADAKVDALYCTPGGVTTGPGSFVDHMMQAAGLANFETTPGWRALPLERLAYSKPDATVVARFGEQGEAVDAWSAANHPVLPRSLAGLPSSTIEGAWTSCGGWFVVDGVEAMSRLRGAP